jgi:hypothetical protein
MRTSYAYLNTLPSLPVDVAALVIRGEDPTRVSAVLAHREEINFRQRCLLCGGDHSAEDCPRIHPIDATALLAEADAALPQHPGPRCDCPACQRATDRLADAAMMYRLCLEAGLLCQYCGEAHADAACPQRQSVLPTVQPTHCGNCGGRHSIQQCSDIRRLLFAA